ncbi:hypothetical protein J6590_065003 [Homalodisca vitripennis]|nr:hypothetical protein J6590_065003 [Homalodisca vitripennis]
MHVPIENEGLKNKRKPSHCSGSVALFVWIRALERLPGQFKSTINHYTDENGILTRKSMSALPAASRRGLCTNKTERRWSGRGMFKGT